MSKKQKSPNIHYKNVGYKILLFLYKYRYEGRCLYVNDVLPMDRDHWYSVLNQLKDLEYLDYEEARLENDLYNYMVVPKPEGIKTVRDTIDARSRKVQNGINIALTVIIVILTGINIWLSFKT